ncbi:MAG: AsmA family protein [Gammaproteobacteria bacterium]|nr:MAG: AsmA family protein [Gammaproteobacteria bacterium]
MGKLLRLVVFALGGLVLLLVAAAIILPLVVDPNDFKDEIAAAVESKTGRTLSMEGDIGLSVFPWLGLDVGPVSLSNAPGFSGQPFASIDAVQVRIKLLPLLSKELEMDTVVLRGLKVSLETDKNGRTNWSDLAGAAESVEESPEAAPESASAAEVTLAGLAIGGVEISDAGVIWDDQQAGVRYEIEGLSLRTGAIEPGEAVPVELELALDSKQPGISGPVAFAATVALSGDGQTIQLSDAKLKTDLAGDGLPGGRLQSDLGFNATLDLKAQTLAVSGLLLKALGVQLEGELKGTSVLDEPNFSGEIRIREFVPRELMQALDLPPLEVSDATVLGKADAFLQLKAGTDSISLTDIRFRLDDSTLKGHLSVTNFARPAIRFGLQLDRIDVDRYLPPGNDAPPVPPTAAAAAGAQMIPVDTLRALDVEGKLTVGQLKAAGLRSSDISMKLVAKSGVVRVYPAKASMYEGKYQGDIKLDVRGKQPKIFMDERLSGLQVGPLLKDLTGDETLSGKTQAGAKLTATGQTPEEFTKTLNGKVDFKFTDGAVKGFNLAAMIRKAQAKLNGKPMPPDTGPNQTDFSSLTGTASITNGVVRNRDLLAMSPLLRVQGTGDIDLSRESLDYLVTAKVVGSLEGQGGKGLVDLKGIEIPVQLSGTFTNLKYKIKLDRVLKEKTEKKIKKKLNKELEKKFGDKFKGLFQ